MLVLNQITASYQKWTTCRSNHCDFFVLQLTQMVKIILPVTLTQVIIRMNIIY